MTTAHQLETIDRMRRLAFPAGAGREDGIRSGPGYHLAELGEARWEADEDAALRAGRDEQVAAEYGALVAALSTRWGDPQQVGLGARLDRMVLTGDMPEPWSELCGLTDHVHLWWVEERWIVVCAARWGEDQPWLLVAAVTEVDLP
ncbi:hypothetical protein [Streptomyces sp. NPDC101132]|uniref:hypothetical protein n=1 Tax=Streptomyces sp. NPDC101132 TaxID=3366110 RepID=UPI00380A7787